MYIPAHNMYMCILAYKYVHGRRDLSPTTLPLPPSPHPLFQLHRKEFVLVSLSSGSVSRLLEGDREHRHVILSSLPPLPSRPYPRVLLSMGEKGLLLPVRDNRVADVAEVRSPKSKRDLNAHRHVF